MRKLLVLPAIVLVAECLCAGGAAAQTRPTGAQPEEGTITPEVAVRTEDYAVMRQRFRTKLTKPGRVPIKVDSLVPPASVRAVAYYSGDLDLRAWMDAAMPVGGARRPAVVFLHGGFSFGEEDWKMTKPYRDAGFIVITPMLRGENGLGGSYSLFYDEVNDVLAAADYLEKQSYVDPERIYLAGHSAGGTLALLTAMTTKRFAAVASFSGSPDQIIFTRHGIPPALVPFDTADAREFEMRSPLSFAGSLKAPARLFFGTQEPHFRLSTEKTAQVAAERGLDVRSVRVEGSHETAVPEAMAQSIVFFNANRRKP